MQSVHEIHVDLVRLLLATERLVSTEGISAEQGKWADWRRFCLFLNSLGKLQAKLQARLLETRSLPPPISKSRTPPSAEDLAGLDRRVETLRRKRDDLLAAKAAAEEEAAAAAVAATTRDESSAVGTAGGAGPRGSGRGRSSSPTSRVRVRAGGNPAARETRPSALSHAQKSSRGTGARARTGASDGGSRGSELWRGRRRGKIVTAGEQETDAVQADEVAEDIVSMAGRLKESSMAINKTLRTQTRVLEDTGDAAADNVDKVKRENARVKERLRKKRAAMFASWCMMLTVLVTFFATYAFIILPFEKRRGPFVKTNAFAHAAEHPPRLAPQQQQQQQQEGFAAATAGRGGGAAAMDPAVQKELMEERRRQAQEAYVERSRQEVEMRNTQNAGLRLVAEEKERYRQRQAEQMMMNARERKAKLEAAVNEAGEDDVKARGSENIPEVPILEREQEAQQQHGDSVVGSKGNTGVAETDVDGDLGGGEALTAAQEHRRRAQEAYEAQSREVKEMQQTRNADLRLIAEEKERYRDRHARQMMANARERQQARLSAERENASEDAPKSRTIGGDVPPSPPRQQQQQGSASSLGQQAHGQTNYDDKDRISPSDETGVPGDMADDGNTGETTLTEEHASSRGKTAANENTAVDVRVGDDGLGLRVEGRTADVEGAESLDAVRKRLRESLGKRRSERANEF